MMNTLEILAPAGGFESAAAAVRCGADAVYLGGQSFNARRNAENFDGHSLEETVRYCHIRGVRVHLTVNTLLFDSELEKAAQFLEAAAKADVDAFIVQDLAVYHLAKQICTEVPLHASTQMAVHNLDGVNMLAEMGFSRVVLARELSREELTRIIRQSPLETEVFVHGALCTCVSGQCYLSSLLGGRSGNRGMCAQPCRLPFQAKGGIEYGLSLRDLSLVERMGELAEMGVTSLKIEGRMKRPEYVAAAVTACIAAREGKSPDMKALEAVFSRSGFTQGFYTGQTGPDMFGIRQKEDVIKAQGVLKDLEALYRQERKSVPVSFQMEISVSGCRLQCTDEDGHQAAAEGASAELARDKPTSPEAVRRCLSKTGNTPYFPSSTEIKMEGNLAVPVSQINALRREALSMLDNQRSISHRYQINPRPAGNHPTAVQQAKTPSLKLRARFHTIEGLTQDIVDNTDFCTLPLGDVFNSFNNPLLKGIPWDKISVELPRIDYSDGSKTLEMLRAVKSAGITRAWAGNLGALRLALDAGMEPGGDWALNITNATALEQYQQLGLREAILSWELSLARGRGISRIAGIPCGVMAYGHLPLMVMRNCPIQNAAGCKSCRRGKQAVRDRKGQEFFLDCPYGPAGAKGTVELYNAIPLFLADKLSDISGFSTMTLYFTKETPDEMVKVLQAYREGKPWDTLGLKGGYTRGLSYRNVL